MDNSISLLNSATIKLKAYLRCIGQGPFVHFDYHICPFYTAFGHLHIYKVTCSLLSINHSACIRTSMTTFSNIAQKSNLHASLFNSYTYWLSRKSTHPLPCVGFSNLKPPDLWSFFALSRRFCKGPEKYSMKEHVKSYTNYLLTNHIELQRIEIVASVDLFSRKAGILVIVIKASREIHIWQFFPIFYVHSYVRWHCTTNYRTESVEY